MRGRRTHGPAGRPADGRRARDRDRPAAGPAGDGVRAPRRRDDRLHAGGLGGRYLKEMTGGRGPDKVIEAVGMEAHGTGAQYAYDRVKQARRLETDRSVALREAIMACRKGGIVSVLGVFGLVDKLPMGVIMNKGLTVRGAQQHGQHYMPRLLEWAANGELDPSFLVTHRLTLEDGAKGYDLFKNKKDGCVRVVFTPDPRDWTRTPVVLVRSPHRPQRCHRRRAGDSDSAVAAQSVVIGAAAGTHVHL